MRCRRLSLRVALMAMATFGAVSAAAAADDWKDALAAALKSRYVVTTRSWTGHVERPGTVLVIQKEGLMADRPKVAMKPTVIRNGTIEGTGGGGLVLGLGGRALKTGDHVYVFDIRVKDDAVIMIIATVDTVDVATRGSTRASTQEAALSFAYDPAALRTASADQVAEAISPWLRTETETSASKTVALGQTMDDVKKALGTPEKIVDLGAKVVYVYRDMKIVFKDGKVADVQ
jgi:hypothetical protein